MNWQRSQPAARPGFARMISLIDEGVVDGIMVWHPDRLSRNEMDGAAICYWLRKKSLKDLQFVNYTFVNSPEGIMMLQLIFSQSQYYSSKLGIEVTRGITTKLENGWRPGVAPPGYWNNKADRTVIPDPERFVLIRKAWELMLTGAYTIPQVLNVVNGEWGYCRTRPITREGGQFVVPLFSVSLTIHSIMVRLCTVASATRDLTRLWSLKLSSYAFRTLLTNAVSSIQYFVSLRTLE